MRVKPKIRYVDMAIYVDKHVHEPNHDVKRIYNYLRMLAYMLAIKRRFFQHEWYYDRFSDYLAIIVYLRIVNADKNPQISKRTGKVLNPGDRGYLTPVTSCLNYMKQILYAKKCEFCNAEFEFRNNKANDDETIALMQFTKSSVLDSNRDLLVCDIKSYIKSINTIIWDEIEKGVYGNDKLLSYELYTSCLLSLLRNITPSYKNLTKLNNAKEHLTYNEDMMSDIMYDENKTAAVAYNLEPVYVDYVAYLLQKIKARIITDITELSDEYSISDDMIEDIIMAGWSVGDE